MEFLCESLESVRLLDWVQILTLEVLDQGHFQSHCVRNISNDDWNAAKASALSSTPTTFTCDELMAETHFANHQGLHDSTGLD
jgi:hypothetical protein